MLALLPPDLSVVDERALFAAYAPPRIPWVRANFVSSADGAASLDGSSGGLGSPGDQQVFALLRAHADVVVVGAGTVRSEGYGPVRHTASRQALREEAGRTAPARLAVVSRRCDFTGAERWIAEAPVPPLLLTVAGAARSVPGAETVVCGQTDVDANRMLDALLARGLNSVLCEGGPATFGDVAGSGRLDELCLTLSPTLAGPGASRIVSGAVWPAPQRAALVQVIEDAGLLFVRYQFGAPRSAH